MDGTLRFSECQFAALARAVEREVAIGARTGSGIIAFGVARSKLGEDEWDWQATHIPGPLSKAEAALLRGGWGRAKRGGLIPYRSTYCI